MTTLAAQRRKFRISSSRENRASSQESWKREERAKEQAQRAPAAAVNANRSRCDRAGARPGGSCVSPEQRHAAASGGEKDEGRGRMPSYSWQGLRPGPSRSPWFAEGGRRVRGGR
eukprot:g13300.t1